MLITASRFKNKQQTHKPLFQFSNNDLLVAWNQYVIGITIDTIKALSLHQMSHHQRLQ